MLRLFRHYYVSYQFLAFLTVEGWIVSAVTFAAIQLDRLGLGPNQPGPGAAVSQAIVLSLLVQMMLYLGECYDLRRDYGRRELFLRLFLAVTGAYLLMAAIGYLGPTLSLSRRAYALSFVLSFGALFGLRLVYRRLLESARNRQRLLLLGAGRPAQIIAETVNGSNPNYEIVGCLDGHPDRVGQQLGGIKILGAVENLREVTRAIHPDVIVVALTQRRQSLPLEAMLECKLRGIEVEDWPDFYEKLTGKILLPDLRPSWLIFSDGFRINKAVLRVKRAMDASLAAVGLIVSLPLFPLIALFIKLDSPGPIFYRQERLGRGGKPFWLIKFRSMRADAEQQTGPVWAGADDWRVTRVGRVLRRARLDELPQLFNVLHGEMSLVGPRPERPHFVAELQEKIPFYIHRLAVKPGVTGWAQVNYRYGASVEDAMEKLQYDFYYIKNLSIFLDLVILLQTVQTVLLAKGSR